MDADDLLQQMLVQALFWQIDLVQCQGLTWSSLILYSAVQCLVDQSKEAAGRTITGRHCFLLVQHVTTASAA